MFNELLKNVMNLGIITEDDVKRLTAIELMMLIIERINGLLNHVEIVDAELINLLENIRTTTIEELNNWKQDGTFEELINQTLLKTVDKTFIYVEDFGAKGDGTDDTSYIQSAIDYGAEHSLEVRFKNKLYRTTRPLVLHQSSKLVGTNSSHFASNTIIRNAVSTMFGGFPTSPANKITDITLKDICFDGKNTNFMNNDSGQQGYLYWSKISNCNFREFTNILGNIALTGCDLSYLNIKANEFGSLNGSDNTFYNIFIDSTEFDVKKDYMLVVAGTVNNLTNIFFTGNTNINNLATHGCKGILRVAGSNNLFSNCWFDYCEDYAIDLNDSSVSNSFVGNVFRGCGSLNNVFIYNKGTNNTFVASRFALPHIEHYPYASETFKSTNESYTQIATSVMGNIINTGTEKHYLKKLITTKLSYDGATKPLTFNEQGVGVMVFDIPKNSAGAALYKLLNVHLPDSKVTFLKAEADHETGKLTVVLRAESGYVINTNFELTVESFRIV